MGYINKKNKVGSVAVAPILAEGELAIDLNPVDGDVGRVYVGDGTGNVPLAKKSETDALDTKLDNLTTSAVAEGTNLYYTDERVDDRVSNLLKAGANVSLSYDDVAGELTISANGTSVTSVNASEVVNTPAGNIVATTVQEAINELDIEKVSKVISTDNAIVRFDGTSGQVQNSTAILDDGGNLTVDGEVTGTSFNSITALASVAPVAPDVTAAVGTSTTVARQDHVHPTNFTVTATDIKMNGTQDVGTLTTFPRADHVHPVDTSRAPLAPNYTGTMADITAAGTTNIGAATADYLNVTGTTTITAFDTAAAGIERTLKFSNALTLTHNATSLILPTGANITTVAGDTAVFRSEGSGNWRLVGGAVYSKDSGTTWVANDSRAKTALNAVGTAPIYACRAWVNFNGNGTIAIRGSGNVSSITDNGLGAYTANFITAMVDVKYSISTNYIGGLNSTKEATSSYTPTGVSLYIDSAGSTAYEPTAVFLAVFR